MKPRGFGYPDLVRLRKTAYCTLCIAVYAALSFAGDGPKAHQKYENVILNFKFIEKDLTKKKIKFSDCTGYIAHQDRKGYTLLTSDHCVTKGSKLLLKAGAKQVPIPRVYVVADSRLQRPKKRDIRMIFVSVDTIKDQRVTPAQTDFLLDMDHASLPYCSHQRVLSLKKRHKATVIGRSPFGGPDPRQAEVQITNIKKNGSIKVKFLKDQGKNTSNCGGDSGSPLVLGFDSDKSCLFGNLSTGSTDINAECGTVGAYKYVSLPTIKAAHEDAAREYTRRKADRLRAARRLNRLYEDFRKQPFGR